MERGTPPAARAALHRPNPHAPPMNPLLNTAVKAARRAGLTLLRHIDRLERITVEVKGPGDFVSAVDRMAEDDIVDIVRARYPNHRIIAEERGVVEGAADAKAAAAAAKAKTAAGKAKDAEIEWLIDPLDGTTNYLHGHPHFAVSIAVKQRGQVQHAVIYDPLRDEMFTASRGQGAYLNRRRLRVTKQRRLRRCLLATGVHYHGGDLGRARFEAWRRCFDALLPRAVDIRRGGSAALDLAYIACGRLDGYWQPGLAAWDAAAGALLVREAGGFVADFQGRQRFLETGEIIASNPLIFNELFGVVSGAVEVEEAAQSTQSAEAEAAQSAPAEAETAAETVTAKITLKTMRKTAAKTVKSAKKSCKKRAKTVPRAKKRAKKRTEPVAKKRAKKAAGKTA